MSEPIIDSLIDARFRILKETSSLPFEPMRLYVSAVLYDAAAKWVKDNGYDIEVIDATKGTQETNG